MSLGSELVNAGYQHDDINIIDYELWPLHGQRLRGPAPDPNDPYFSVLGAAQVFGRFVPAPFPAMIARDIGLPALNLGMSGAGPSFYLLRPELIEVANKSRFAIVQLMSGRSVGNSRIAIGANQGVGRMRREPDAPPRFAEDLFRRLLTELDPGELAVLRAEMRDRYVTEMGQLLDAIRVPKILLYWSKRPVEYSEGVGDLSGYWGDFPHFVNRDVVDALRPRADDFVEIVTSRGSPQPLFDKRTGQPVLMWPEDRFPDVRLRAHNHYYPSPEMHADAAAAIVPAAAQMMERPGAAPPVVTRTIRHAILHAHIFKNAGSSVDRSLKESFQERWVEIDPQPPGLAIGSDAIFAELAQRPDVKAISTHAMRFPLEERDDIRIHPILFLRDPILRAQSIYEFERLPARRDFDAPHTAQAQLLSFPEWIAWCLQGPAAAGPIANFQTRICSVTRNGSAIGDWYEWVGLDQYREAVDQLGRCHVGRVDRLPQSLFRIETALRPFFPELQLLPYAENASREPGRPTRRTRESIAAELGRPLYARLCEANAWDLLLYDRYA